MLVSVSVGLRVLVHPWLVVVASGAVCSDLDRDRRERRRDRIGTTEKHERIRTRDKVETEEEKAQRRRQQGASSKKITSAVTGSSRRVTPVAR